MANYSNFGKTVKKLRIDLDMNQSKLSKNINLSLNEISLIEREIANIGLVHKAFFNILNFLNDINHLTKEVEKELIISYYKTTGFIPIEGLRYNRDIKDKILKLIIES